jgi:hypothetical protein
MNYNRFAENKTAHDQMVMNEVGSGTASASPNATIRRWCFSVSVTVIGLLALLFFLAMGGMFALVGPWVILTGTMAARKRPGWQVFGIMTGVGFLFLGTATVLLPAHAVYSVVIGEGLGLLLGLGYLAGAFFRMQ